METAFPCQLLPFVPWSKPTPGNAIFVHTQHAPRGIHSIPSLPMLERLLRASLLQLILLFLWQNCTDFCPQNMAPGRQNIKCILVHVWHSVRKMEMPVTLKRQRDFILHHERERERETHSVPGRNQSHGGNL